MLQTGSTLHVMLPDATGAVALHAALVLEAEGSTCLAGLEIAPACVPLPGTEVPIAFQVRGRFFQQTAMVAVVRDGESFPVIALTMLGEPVSAEKRGTFRVSTIDSGITMRIEKEKTCQLADVSATGFAAICKCKYEVSKFVTVMLDYDAFTMTGAARIQTATPLDGGKTRYGFMVLPSRLEMRRTLEKLAFSEQRKQLRQTAKSA